MCSLSLLRRKTGSLQTWPRWPPPRAEGAGCRIVRPYASTRTSWTLLYDDGSAAGARLDDAAAKTLLAAPLDEAALVPCGETVYFCERCQASERMIIVGGGHVSRPTAAIAGLTGFAVHVLDDRPEYANSGRFPNAEVHVTPEYARCFDALHVTPRDYIVIVTRGHLFDGVAAAQALRTPAGYIGMIGSTRKRQQIYAKLLESGFTEQDLARIHASHRPRHRRGNARRNRGQHSGRVHCGAPPRSRPRDMEKKISDHDAESGGSFNPAAEFRPRAAASRMRRFSSTST